MKATFRQSMAWLHTWAGVVLSGLLFAIFWMGTLSVFDREIDRWMMPMTRLPAQAATAPLSLDATVRPVSERLAVGASQWYVFLPSERVPTVQLGYRDAAGEFVTRHLDPTTGALLPDVGTRGGTGFIFPFHYSLHLRFKSLGWFKDLGYWLVGLAGMAMLVALVSGVIIHRQLFRNFFRFQPEKRRAALDLHNVTGVLALPFHFVITLSGLIIFFSIFFSSGWQVAYQGDRQAFFKEAFGAYTRPRAGTPGALGALDAMVQQAQRLWGDGKPYFVRVWHPGDANAYVEVRRSFADRITMTGQTVYFDGATGAVLSHERPQPVMTVQRFMSGLHFIQFEHWTLRWLYFALGLCGCVMIATGFLYWLAARRVQHATKGLAGVGVVQALTVGSTAGIVIATLAFFVANRLLPLGVSFAGAERATLEMWAFFGVWVATFAHAGLRARRAWVEQSWTIAALALAAVLLNAITTGDHLLQTLAAGQWGVAGMDALLLVTAGIAAWAARRLQGRAQGARGAPAAVPGQAQSVVPAAEQAAATAAPIAVPPPAREADHA